MIKTLSAAVVGMSAVILSPASAYSNEDTERFTEVMPSATVSKLAPNITEGDIIQPVTAPELKTDPKNDFVMITVIPNPEPEPELPRETNDSSAVEINVTQEAVPEKKKETPQVIPSSGHGSSIVNTALKYVGTPYVSGGKNPSGFDCSGFTSYVFAQHGITIPSSSSGQRNAGTVVSSPEPGDIIWTPGHVGIYVGKGQQIDAPRPGKTVQVRGIWQSNPTYIRIS